MPNAQYILLADFGSTYTKCVAIDLISEQIVGIGKSPTTVETDIMDGYYSAIDKISYQFNHKPVFYRKVACSSAAGGLRMVTIGLIPDLTSAAAQNAALGAGAKVEKVYAGILNNSEVSEIEMLEPDIIILCGGTDGGNDKVVRENTKKIVNLKINSHFIYAGNKEAKDFVKDEFVSVGKEISVAENVMPEIGVLNIESAQREIREIFLRNIIHAKGIKNANKHLDNVLMPTPMAVLKAAELVANGTRQQIGSGAALIVDLGGATTDIHSASYGKPTMPNVITKGLPEPYLKRTVEGDIGMRYNLEGIIKNSCINDIAEDCLLDQETVANYCSRAKKNVKTLPESSEELKVERSLAKIAVEIAIKRHAGFLNNVFTPMGELFVQTGKDLSDVSVIIGTGGAIVESDSPIDILKKIAFNPFDPFSLRPKNAKIFLDSKYILFAVGLLSEIDQNIALRIAKKYLTQIN